MVGDYVFAFEPTQSLDVRARLIVNPLARRGHLAPAVAAMLVSLGIELSKEETVDAVIVAGGDGTIARQVPHALALDVPIGVVPLGTFNDLARTLGVPMEIEAACSIIASGRTRRIDAARVNETYYLTEASIGISSRIARRQRPQDKQRFGFLAVVASALEAARSVRPFRAEVRFDGKRVHLRAVQLTVANSGRFGGVISVQNAAIDDGRLDLYAVEIESLRDAISVARSIVAGRQHASPGLRTFHSSAFEVRTRRPHHITADGEPGGFTPARFEVVRKRLSVFVP